MQGWSAPWTISVVALLSALVARNKKRFLVLAIALLLGASVMSLRLAALQTSALTSFQGSTAKVVLQVTTDPNRVAPKVRGTSFAPTSFSFIGQAMEVDSRFKLRIPVRVYASTRSVEGLLPGTEDRSERHGPGK